MVIQLLSKLQYEDSRMAAEKLLFYTTLLVNLQLGSGSIQLLTPSNFRVHPLNTSVDEGQPVIMDCEVDATIQHCYWTRDANQYRVNPGMTNNYSFMGNKVNGDCAMRIDKASIYKDDGNWSCHILTNNGQQGTSNAAILTVQTPPKVFLTKDSEPIQPIIIAMQTGDNTTDSIACVAQGGNPPAEIFWLMDYDQMPSFEMIEMDAEESKKFTVYSWLNIAVSQENHNKTVCCQVNHPALRRPIEKKFILLVEYPTFMVDVDINNRQNKIIISPDDSNLKIMVHVGHPIQLHCQANGFPEPYYTWIKLDDLSDSSNPTVISSKSTLQVGNKKNDEGIYKCLSQNKLNKKPIPSHIIHVKIEYAASNVTIISEVQGSLAEGSVVTLTCKADGYPVPEIRWLKGLDDLRIPISGGEKLIFRNFTAADQGLYQCTAFNTHNSREVASDAIHLQIPGILSTKVSNESNTNGVQLIKGLQANALNSARFWSDQITGSLCLIILFHVIFVHIL